MDRGCACASENVAEINLNLSIFVKAYKFACTSLVCSVHIFYLFLPCTLTHPQISPKLISEGVGVLMGHAWRINKS